MVRASGASKRYAEAFVESVVGQDKKALHKVVEEVGSVAGAVEMSRDLEQLLENPAFSGAERNQVLDAVLEHLGVSERTRRFVELLAQKSRLGELSAIAEHLEYLAEERAGRTTAIVESATELTASTLDHLRKALEKRTGKSVEMEVRIDPDLIGGMRARVGTFVLDGTIRSELDRLKARLMTR